MKSCPSLHLMRYVSLDQRGGTTDALYHPKTHPATLCSLSAHLLPAQKYLQSVMINIVPMRQILTTHPSPQVIMRQCSNACSAAVFWEFHSSLRADDAQQSPSSCKESNLRRTVASLLFINLSRKCNYKNVHSSTNVHDEFEILFLGEIVSFSLMKSCWIDMSLHINLSKILFKH